MDETLYNDSLTTEMISGHNGKFCGSGRNMNPFAILNDGYMDLTVQSERIGRKQFLDIFGKAGDQGAIQGYH